MRWTIGMKIGSGFALELAALVIVGAISYRSTTGLIHTAAAVEQTHLVLANLEKSISSLKDAETGQRGYVITGEERYLEPYTAGVLEVRQWFEKLRNSITDPTQRQRLTLLDQLIEEKLQEMKAVLDLRKKGFEQARQQLLTDKGKNLMDSIRKTINEIESEEYALLARRSEESRQRVDQTHFSIVAGTLIAFALLMIAGFFITRNISAPLYQISGVAERIAEGDLGVSVTHTERSDEVGQLSRTFGRMQKSLQDMATVAKRIAASDLSVGIKPLSDADTLGNSLATMLENLRRSTTDLADGINVLAASSSEILASTTQVASSAAETGTAIAQTTSTVEEVKQTAQVASQKAKYVSDSAQKAMQVAQSGRKSVDSSIDGMKKIQTQMESIAESVVKLSEQGQAIGEIIATVNDLAEQSNLLAVNAAIEAAKAGEHGKGFSVVAQEVKSLADQSKQATAQVRTILNDIQKATTAAVLATEQGSKAVEAGVKQSSEAGDSIRLLADSITEASQAAIQIAASSQQQLVGTDQVAMAMENIKQASMQNVVGTKQAETAAHNLHDLGQKLKKLVDQYRM